MNGIGLKNLQQSLQKFVRITRDEGVIDAGATNILLPAVNKSWIVNQHVGYYVQVFSGGSLSYEWSIVTANTANTLSILPALSFAPAPGDILVILDITSPSGPAPGVDVTEWGGVAVTGADITPNIQNLDLAITALRDAIAGVGAAARTQGQIEAAIIATEPRDIVQWGGVAVTGADITPNIQNLDLAITALRDAIAGVGAAARTLGQIEAAIIAVEPRNTSQWGGVALTGADITTNLQNLDLATTALRDAIIGVSNNTLTDIVNALTGATSGEVVTIANNVAINGGVVGVLNNYQRWTLFIYVSAAINITVELSPDGGTNYYDIAESPISFAVAGDGVYEMGYIANRIRLTGSNASLCTIQARGKF